MIRRTLISIAFLVLSSATVLAGGCPQHSPGGVMPAISNETLFERAAELCYQEFGIVHSGLTRTPLWVSEHITRDRVVAARTMDREDVFAAEETLPAADRAELSDYARSGFDRGHMAPSGNMSDTVAQAESFTLANIVPQHPENNRGLWREIESIVRDMAMDTGELYVVTGPLFVGDSLAALKGRVLVPTHIFKAVYNPVTGAAGVYVAQNDGSGVWGVMSVDQLLEISGFDVFPNLPAETKSVAAQLPSP